MSRIKKIQGLWPKRQPKVYQSNMKPNKKVLLLLKTYTDNLTEEKTKMET